MGSPCSIQFYAAHAEQAQRVIQLVKNDVYRLEARFSRYRDDSFLSEINRVAAHAGSIEVDPETAGLLDYAATCYQQSEGLFDVTSGILRQAWNFKSNTIPDSGVIESLLEKIGWEKLNWRAPVLTFTVSGMEIDLGGVVKEYATDRAASLCREAGVEYGVVNLGGDIKIIGPHDDGSPWRIAIKHPRNPEGVLTTLILDSGAVASSGDYERCITLNGVRYGHVLNPKTGWPVNYMAAVSVIGEFCVVAGSASTIAMLKQEQGAMWLRDLGLPHVWMNVNGESGGYLGTHMLDAS